MFLFGVCGLWCNTSHWMISLMTNNANQPYYLDSDMFFISKNPFVGCKEIWTSHVDSVISNHTAHGIPKGSHISTFFLEDSFKNILFFITIWVPLKTNLFDKNETFISWSMKTSTRDGSQSPRARPCWFDTYQQYVRDIEQDRMSKVSTCSL